MSTEMQAPQNILSTFAPFELTVSSTHGLQRRTSPASAQPSAHKSVDAVLYPESATQWLIGLLDLLAGIVDRNRELSRVVVSKTEYQRLSVVLDDLIYGVGEDEDHPLSAAMSLIGILVKAYEDHHFPKLADLYPELTEDSSVESVGESVDAVATISGQIGTDFSSVFFSIGYLFSESCKEEKAIFAYDLAIRVKSDYTEAYNNRGVEKNNVGQREEAITDFDKAIHLNPDLAEPYMNRGVVMLELGQYEKAIVYHDKALELKPDYVDAYYNRGIAKYALGKREEAKVDFQTALELAEHLDEEDLKEDLERWLQEFSGIEAEPNILSFA